MTGRFWTLVFGLLLIDVALCREPPAYEAAVAERNLMEDDTEEPVNHPLLDRFFVEFDGISYSTGKHVN